MSDNKRDTAHKIHAQIMEVIDKTRSGCVIACIEDRDGNIILKQGRILASWHEYISVLIWSPSWHGYISGLYDDNMRYS